MTDRRTELPSSPRRRRLLATLGVGLAVPLVLAGCGGAEAREAELQAVLDAEWQKRFGADRSSGGLTLYMETGDDTYFASTVEGATAGSHFRAASTTKTFTAAAVMLLDQQGLLRIDDRVVDAMPGRSEPYLPATVGYAIPNKERITIRLLLQHRAGVFDLSNQDVPASADAPYAGGSYLDWRRASDPRHTFTLDELAGVLAEHQLSNFEPGERYGYSDSGFMLLGKIIERVSGLPLHEFKRRNLLEPNGLASTHFVSDGGEQALPAPFIRGYSQIEAGAVPQETTEYNYTYDPGSGNLVTTPRDLARWVRRLGRGEAGISAAQVARMREVQADSNYGLGLIRREVDGTLLGYGHNGGTLGYLTDAYHDEDTGISYVLQASRIDFLDLGGQIGWLGEVGVELRRVATKKVEAPSGFFGNRVALELGKPSQRRLG